MLKKTLFIYLLICQLAVLGCARKKEATVEQSCTQQTAQAEQLQQGKTASLDKKLNETIRNLIIAAKIHAQHAQYILCIDKTQRALSLLENTASVKTEKN